MTTELKLVIVAGLLSLAGVLIGGFLAPITQLYIEKNRERRDANRAQLLVAGELLQLQMHFEKYSKGQSGSLDDWPSIEDVNSYFPTTLWESNRSLLVDNIDENLYNQLVMTYTKIFLEKERVILINKFQSPLPQLSKEQAEIRKDIFNELGQLRRQLGSGGGFKDEFEKATIPK